MNYVIKYADGTYASTRVRWSVKPTANIDNAVTYKNVASAKNSRNWKEGARAVGVTLLEHD